MIIFRPEENIELAFAVAEDRLGVSRLLEVEWLRIRRPEPKSTMLYVSMLHDELVQL